MLKYCLARYGQDWDSNLCPRGSTYFHTLDSSSIDIKQAWPDLRRQIYKIFKDSLFPSSPFTFYDQLPSYFSAPIPPEPL